MISKSLVTGAPITNKDGLQCNECKEQMDCHGYHAVSCTAKGLMTKRHDAICDKFYDFCVKAKLDVLKEQRYKDDGNGGKVRIEGRPGDIKINNYFTTTSKPKGAESRDLYIDFTVCNIFKSTYIDTESKKR